MRGLGQAVVPDPGPGLLLRARATDPIYFGVRAPAAGDPPERTHASLDCVGNFGQVAISPNDRPS
jgi:hypothetical protein